MKRTAIYVYHDKFGRVGDYAIFYIKSLLEVADEIIVVINGKLKENEIEKFNLSRVSVIKRKNKGYDFFGYKEGFLSLDFEHLSECDELIFCNSSTFGPLYPFSDMFKSMINKDIDFWGITKHPKLNKNVIKFNSKTKIKEHIQSYFLVFRQNMFLSKNFREYFENLDNIKSKKEAIGLLEVNLTEHFKNLGFVYDTYVEDEILDFGIANYCQYLPDILVEKYKCPLIKKTIFGERFDLAQKESLGNKTSKLFDFIKNNTEYDVNLIIKEISRIYSSDEIKNFLNLNYVLNENFRERFLKDKCAFVFENFDNIFDEIKLKFKDFHSFFDLFCINDTIKDKDLVVNSFDENLSVFKQIKDLTKDYEYILFFFKDNSLRALNSFQKKEYLSYLFDSAILNRYYLANITDVFIKNPYVGVLSPLPFIFQGFNIQNYGIDRNDVKHFLSKTGLELNVNYKYLNTVSPVFWMSKEALQAVDDMDFYIETKLNRGAIFSLYAQNKGFLTGRISNAKTFGQYINSLEYYVLKENKFLSQIAYKLGKRNK